MSATADFMNIPAWLKTAVDTNGKFKKLNVKRRRRTAAPAQVSVITIDWRAQLRNFPQLNFGDGVFGSAGSTGEFSPVELRNNIGKFRG